MEITRENYERYFIDYLDGKLTGKGEEEILEFLGENPDLATELKDLEKIILIPAEEIFPGKPGVKKTLISMMSEKNLTFDELCAASVEGDLQDNENGIIYGYLNRDEVRRKEYELFRKTILQTDITVFYPYKKLLRHKTIIQRTRQLYLAVNMAAAVIMALLFVLNSGRDHSDRMVTSEQITTVPGNENNKESTDIIVGKRNTGSYPISTELTIAQPVKPREYFQGEQILLTKVISKNTVLLNNAVNYHDFTLRWDNVKSNTSAHEYLEPGEFLIAMLRKKILKEEQTVSKDGISLREIADAGLQELTNLTAGNFYVTRSYDQDGRMNHLTFETPIFGFSAPISHNNNPQ